MTDAFLNTSDYDVAINYIESLDRLTPNLKKTYQEVTFLKGADQFNNRKFSSSVKYFDKSLAYRISAERAIEAFYWKGEAFSIGKLYEKAVEAYKSSLYITSAKNEGNLLHVKARYGLGYAYYNQQDYSNAMANFITYLTNIPLGADAAQFFADDARLRLADCYYVTKDYQNAEETYQRLLGVGNSKEDYILFQLGLVNSLQSRDAAAGSYFQKVITGHPKSAYLDNAILQDAEIYFESGDYQPAVQGFSKLITEQPDSPLIPFALVKRALAYSNLGKVVESEKDYKKVLDDYITHETANNALRGLQELSANQEIADFNVYLRKYQQANPDDESLEIVEYEAAKSLYFNQLYTKAIDGFKQFQQRYPNSSQLTEADYYIADSYYRSGDGSAAIPFLKSVVADDQNTFQRRALDRLGTLLIEENAYDEAIQYFKQLESKARNPRERGNAWEGMMTTYWQTEAFEEAVAYAERIIESPKMSSDLKSVATLTLAKASIRSESYQDAEDYLIELVNGIKDETAAEANYELGRLYYSTKRYKTSLQTLFELNKNFAQYSKWLGK
ncbi:MAG: tetratricopeptide repeat protein, partial [Bacteroidota bacterium]